MGKQARKWIVDQRGYLEDAIRLSKNWQGPTEATILDMENIMVCRLFWSRCPESFFKIIPLSWISPNSRNKVVLNPCIFGQAIQEIISCLLATKAFEYFGGRCNMKISVRIEVFKEGRYLY